MKLYDIIIAKKTSEGKTFWRTIGTVFCGDNAKICGKNNKPAGFSIDYPEGNGIIVLRKKKEEKEKDSSENVDTEYQDLPI